MTSLWLLPLLLASASPTRHVLIVANNTDPAGELSPLKYADDDGARYAELFSSAGARVELLTTLDAESQRLFPHLVGQSRPPTRERLLAAAKHVFENIRQDKREGHPSELIFVFTGHGKVREDGAGEILLGDGPFSREELFREIIDASPADFNHVIIDACNAYFMVMGRGDTWKDDRGDPATQNALQAYLSGPTLLTARPTTGVILSTAGTAEVHEWERFRAGVFSHELRSALLGPADVNGDGNTTYNEIEAFLRAANAGVRNPKARVQVFVQAPRQDLGRPVLDLIRSGINPVLRFPAEVAGHFQVEDGRGIAYAEWNKAPDHPAYLALLLPPVQDQPRYFIRRGEQEMRVELPAPGVGPGEYLFSEGGLVSVSSGSRGTVAESFRLELFSVPFGLAFLQGFAVSKEDQPAAEITAQAPAAAAGGHLLAVGYQLARAPIATAEISQGLQLTYHLAPWRVFELVFHGGWSRFVVGDPSPVDEILVMIGAGLHFEVARRLQLIAELAAGNHFIAREGDGSGVHGTGGRVSTTWDALNPTFALTAGLRWLATDWLFVQLSGGISLQLAIVGGETGSTWNPGGLAEIGFVL